MGTMSNKLPKVQQGCHKCNIWVPTCGCQLPRWLPCGMWVSLTCSLSLAARWRDTARSRPRRRVAFLTCLIVGQNACDTLMGNRLKIFGRKALYGEGFCGSFSKRHGELAYCVGCTNIFTCLLRLSSGSKYTSQWSTRNNSCFWRTSLALYSRNF